MCGLVGVAGQLFQADKKAFRTLLMLDAIRGEDSTGVGVIRPSGKIEIDKAVGHPVYLLEYGSTSIIDHGGLINGDMKAVVGHNRWATVGKVTVDNAHPFHIGNVMGAHNGTLNKQFLSNLDDRDKFDVDSQLIINGWNKEGPSIINKVCGAYALTIYDGNEECMYFIRGKGDGKNQQRPLHYVRSKDGQAFYWASEPWMLRIALGRANVDYDFDTIGEFKLDMLYRLSLKKAAKHNFKETELEEVRELEGFTPPPVVQNVVKIGTTGGINKKDRRSNDNPFPVPNHLKKHSAKVHIDYEKLRGNEGKTVKFWGVNVVKSESGQSYVKCLASDVENAMDLRVFGGDAALWKLLTDGISNFSGTIKKVVKYKVRNQADFTIYGVIDPRSIVKAPSYVEQIKDQIKKNKEPEFTGFQGVNLTTEQYFKATNNGCWNCAAPALVSDYKDIIFIDHQAFLCKECSALPIMKDVIDGADQLAKQKGKVN